MSEAWSNLSRLPAASHLGRCGDKGIPSLHDEFGLATPIDFEKRTSISQERVARGAEGYEVVHRRYVQGGLQKVRFFLPFVGSCEPNAESGSPAIASPSFSLAMRYAPARFLTEIVETTLSERDPDGQSRQVAFILSFHSANRVDSNAQVERRLRKD